MAYHKVNLLFFILYMVLMTALMIFAGVGITPDRYVLVLILASLFVHKTRAFLMDWLPFIFILISYDFLRSLAPALNSRVHFVEMINFDNALFGQSPVIFLQNALYVKGNINWYDYFATLFYFLHFALPLGFGFILWIKNRHYFKRFANAVLILSYSAFATFVIFPASPPWLAAEKGYFPHVVKILDITLRSFPDRLGLPTIYYNFNPNSVAAVPSLHAAYPFLVLFFAVKFFKLKGLFFIPYVLGTWWAIVYLGEHYVADIVAGIIYALFAYILTNFLFKIWQHSKVREFFEKFSPISPF